MIKVLKDNVDQEKKTSDQHLKNIPNKSNNNYEKVKKTKTPKMKKTENYIKVMKEKEEAAENAFWDAFNKETKEQNDMNEQFNAVFNTDFQESDVKYKNIKNNEDKIYDTKYVDIAASYIKKEVNEQNELGNSTLENDKDIKQNMNSLNNTESKAHKYKESMYINELLTYVNSTYNSHYSGEIQALDVIFDSGYGTGFNVGNIQKYSKRYGKKLGYNRSDLMKILHYTLLQLYIHDKEGLSNK